MVCPQALSHLADELEERCGIPHIGLGRGGLIKDVAVKAFTKDSLSVSERVYIPEG